MSTPLPPSPAVAAPSESLVTITHVVYALHTLGLVVGAFGTASVIGMFLFGWPSIIAVIINYVKRSDVRGTYLDSHFSWQIRTFWWAMLFAVTIGVVGLVLLPLLGFGLVSLVDRLLRARHLGDLSHRTRLAGIERWTADAGCCRLITRSKSARQERASSALHQSARLPTSAATIVEVMRHLVADHVTPMPPKLTASSAPALKNGAAESRPETHLVRAARECVDQLRGSEPARAIDRFAEIGQTPLELPHIRASRPRTRRWWSTRRRGFGWTRWATSS